MWTPALSSSRHRLHGRHLCRQLDISDLSAEFGTCSPFLNKIARCILLWAESHRVVLAPQFIMGRNNVLADALSRPNQFQGSEWTLMMEGFEELWRRWSVMVDLFATSANRHCSLFFFLSGSPDDTDRSLLASNALGFRTFWIWQWISRSPSHTVQIFSNSRTSIVVI